MKLEDFGGAAQCMPPPVKRRDVTPRGTVLTFYAVGLRRPDKAH
jgi:hypothetical protein